MDVHAGEHVTEAHHLHVFQDFAVAVFAGRFLLTPHCKRMRSGSDDSEPMPCCLLREHPSKAPQLLASLFHGAAGGGEDLDLRLQQIVRDLVPQMTLAGLEELSGHALADIPRPRIDDEKFLFDADPVVEHGIPPPKSWGS